MKTKSVDIRVTDSHKMIYGHHNVPGKWHKKPAGELCGKNFVFPVCGECQPVKFGENHRIFLVNDSKGRYIARTSYDYRRRNKLCIEESKKIANEMWDLRSDIKTKLPHELSITECKFIGFWLGDGSVTRLQSGGLEYKVFQTKRYPQIIKYIDNLVEILNYDVIRKTSKSFLNGKRYHDLVTWSFPRGTGGKSQFRHGIFDIEPYLVKKGTAYFWGLNREQFIALLHGFSMADGGHGDVGFCRISNTNKQLLDLIQSIAVCRNISCSIFKRRGRLKKNHKQIYILQYLVDKRLHHVTTARKRPGFQVEQECMEEVWCVTTQSKNIITRRNGKVCIMGNSEGADFPWVSCIILAKPSKSYARYVQKAGRVSRLYKGKTD
ncbi:MAG: hypothetical protein SVO01_12695, partial [Thermotogota bacterium]|nr:hypothetical protein [Thermotogota bacterium]